jgi:hypothetical protein
VRLTVQRRSSCHDPVRGRAAAAACERIRPTGDPRAQAQYEPALRSVASAGAVTVITFDTSTPKI